MQIQFWKDLEFHAIVPSEELTRIFDDVTDLDARLKDLGWRHFGNIGEYGTNYFYSHYHAPKPFEFKAVIHDHNGDRVVLVNTWVDTKEFFELFAPHLLKYTPSRSLSPVRESMAPDRLN